MFQSKPTFLLLALALTAASSQAASVIIATWGSTVDDGNLEGTAVNYASSAVDSVQGGGMISPGTLVDYIVGETNLQIPGGEIVYATAPSGSVDDTTDAADAIADNQYFQFSFTVGNLGVGETLSLDSFFYSTRANNWGSDRNGWLSSQLAVRVNDTDFTTLDLVGAIDTAIIGSVVNNSKTLNLTGLVNGDVVNFRVYAWGSDNAGGSGGVSSFHGSSRIGAISVAGAAIPEPSTALLSLLVSVALLRRSRRCH